MAEQKYIQLYDEQGNEEFPATSTYVVLDKYGMTLEEVIDDIYAQAGFSRAEYPGSGYVPAEVAYIVNSFGSSTKNGISQYIVTEAFSADRARIAALEAGHSSLDIHVSHLTEEVDGKFYLS